MAAPRPPTTGITAPMRRGHSGMFVTDVIVELGYATRERVDEVINEARVAGRSPEALLREHKVIDADQLSRAIAERYGLDHIDLNVYKVDMGAANLLSVSRRAALQGDPGRLRRPGDAAAGDGRPGERAGGRRHPDDDRAQLPRRGRRRGRHRGPDRAHEHARERRLRGGLRGGGRSRARPRSPSCASRPTTPR